MVEFELIEEVVQLAILFALGQLDEVLLKTVERKLGLVVDVDLERVSHELLADRANLLRKGGAEHHDLLIGGGGAEDLLDVAAHVCRVLVGDGSGDLKAHTDLVQHLVTLVQNEGFDVAQGECLVPHESVEATRCSNDDVGVCLLVLQEFDVLNDWCSTVEDRGLHIWEVLAEARVLVLDLIRKLASMAHDENLALSLYGFELMQCCQDKDRGLTETRLGLAENIDVEHGGWNAYLLNCNSGDVRFDGKEF